MIVTFSRLGQLGELGNQMFQVAATIGYARKYGKEEIFPVWKCGLTEKKYSDIFKGRIKESKGFIPTDFTISYMELKYIELQNFDGNVDLSGYFQSERYFSHCEEEIRELFRPNDKIRDYIEKKYMNILDQSSKVALHIRTYKRAANDDDMHAGCTLEYLEKSQKILDREVYVVFTDNIREAKKILPPNRNYFFPEKEENYIDLFLMGYFDSFIISASSFGWWGAWLGRSSEKKVLVPEKWFNENSRISHLNDNDIVPASWTRVKG